MQPESVDEQPQTDVVDADMTVDTETPDTDATRRTRISTKRPDPAVPNGRGAQEVAHLELTFASAVNDNGNSVRSAGEVCKNTLDPC